VIATLALYVALLTLSSLLLSEYQANYIFLFSARMGNTVEAPASTISLATCKCGFLPGTTYAYGRNFPMMIMRFMIGFLVPFDTIFYVFTLVHMLDSHFSNAVYMYLIRTCFSIATLAFLF